MSHSPKRLILVHPNEQHLYTLNGFVSVATSAYSESLGFGYSDTVDRIILPRPDSTPPGARSVDPDTLTEIFAVTYASAQSPSVAIDAHGDVVLHVHTDASDPFSFDVDLVDPTTLGILSTVSVPTSTFAPFTIGNPSVALLPTASTPQWVATMGNGSAVKILNGSTVTSTIGPPDPTYPLAYSVATDSQGRLAVTWINGSSTLAAHKIVVYDTDLVTILCQYTPTYSGYNQQARFRGTTCFDPDGQSIWYYSGVWHIDLVTLAPIPDPRVFQYALTGTSNNDNIVFDPWGGTFPIDSGGRILVYGDDTVLQEATPRLQDSNFYQRFTASSG